MEILAVLTFYYQQILSGNYDKTLLRDYAIVEAQVAGLSIEDQQKVVAVIERESKFNPKALHANDMAMGCHSRGLVQIRSCNHSVSDEQAYNPIFSISFLIENIDKCKTWWKATCPLYGDT